MAPRPMAEDAQQGPLRLGDRFLKYAIQGLVGKGGHAWVYAGRDEFFERDVAIKILHRLGGVSNDMLRRGRAEAQLLDRLHHPNVVEVIDAGLTDDGLLYIVMELLRGRTLREILRARGCLSIPEALALFLQMTEGVAAAHALNAVHRDLKPENVFVLHDNTPKVLDFGIAKIVDSAGWTTEKDVIHGTVLYMSPEQLQGFRATPRSDIYALGLMFYEVLIGRHPCLLKNTAPTVRELSWIQTTAKPPPLDEMDSAIPRYVARTVAHAIAKLPDDRFASMSDFGAAIRDCLARYGLTAQTDRFPTRDIVESAPSRPVPVMQSSLASTTERMNRGAALPHTAGPDSASVPGAKASTPNTAPPVTTRPVKEADARAHRPRSSRSAVRKVIIASAVFGTTLGGVASLLLSGGTSATAAGTRPSAIERGVSAPAASLQARTSTGNSGTASAPAVVVENEKPLADVSTRSAATSHATTPSEPAGVAAPATTRAPPPKRTIAPDADKPRDRLQFADDGVSQSKKPGKPAPAQRPAAPRREPFAL